MKKNVSPEANGVGHADPNPPTHSYHSLAQLSPGKNPKKKTRLKSMH